MAFLSQWIEKKNVKAAIVYNAHTTKPTPPKKPIANTFLLLWFHSRRLPTRFILMTVFVVHSQSFPLVLLSTIHFRMTFSLSFYFFFFVYLYFTRSFCSRCQVRASNSLRNGLNAVETSTGVNFIWRCTCHIY